MRPRVDWMNQTDVRILELLGETNMTLDPKVIGVNLEYDRDWVTRRLSKLTRAGLTSREDRGLYHITELGRMYLEGELDASQIPDPDTG